MTTNEIYDVVIIGGGINGAGIARDGALRGLKILLCEQADLAFGTSSRSSKLIHGGIRYLENFEFLMVRKALKERDILYRNAPNVISPLKLVLPYEPRHRKAWVIDVGLWLYDHLYSSQYFPKSKKIYFCQDVVGDSLKATFTKGFSYFDAWADDARLVLNNLLGAHEAGATILTHTLFKSAANDGAFWHIELENLITHEITHVKAHCVINAAGPWVDEVLNYRLKQGISKKLKLVKGSHLIFKRFYPGEQAYVLQNQDGRIVFVLPYYRDFVMVGTTEVSYTAPMGMVGITSEEENYLLNTLNQYFKRRLLPEDVLHRYAGVRPLLANNKKNLSKNSRDYQFELTKKDHTLLVSILGGKLTTHRILAEEVLDALKSYFPHMGACVTRTQSLPGALSLQDYSKEKEALAKQYAFLPPTLFQHYLSTYGTRMVLFLKDAQDCQQLGIHFGHDLYQVEVDYLLTQEWARNSDDILWRRTKLGLYFTAAQAQYLEEYCACVILRET